MNVNWHKGDSCQKDRRMLRDDVPKKLLFFRILSKLHQLAQGFQKWHNPNHNKNLYEGLQITEYSKTMHMIFPIVQNWTTVCSTAGSCMWRLWGVVQLNSTNWKTSRGLIPVIVQAQRLKALPFSDIWDSTFYLCVPIYAHEEKLVHDIEVAFEALLNLSNWKTSQGLVKVFMQQAIPDICQFWGATTQFRPVKGHQKMRKFVTE